MNIVIGSLNETKINAVKAVFQEANIIKKAVPSDVPAQPIGDVETRIGAINRAKHAVANSPECIGIGLEGGVMYVENELFLCNWGAVVTTDGYIYTAGGARIHLPAEFLEPLKKGVELSELMDTFTKKQGIRHYEGAVGIFTNGQVLRHEMFTHVVKLLKGQMEYGQQ